MKWFHREMRLVRLTRTLEDDLHYSPLGIVGLSPSMIVERAVSDFQIIHGLGGIYVFSFHSQGFSSPEFVGIFPDLVNQFRQTGTWIATAEDVANWWELRSHISVGLSDLGARGVRLTVKYSGGAPLENAAITLYPPGDMRTAHLFPAGVLPISAQILTTGPDSRLTLNLKKLNPGMNQQFDLLWDQ
jgi:hypothetical protein